MKNRVIHKFRFAAAGCLMAVLLAAVIFLMLPAFAQDMRASAEVAPSSLWTTVGDVTLQDNAESPDFAQPGNGMLVTFKQSDAEIRYKNEIDLSENTTEDLLFSFMPVPSAIGVQDYKEIQIKFTDALDPENYLIVAMRFNSYDQSATYWSLSYNGSATTWRSTTWGTKPLNPSFDGLNTLADQGVYVNKTMLGVPYSQKGDKESPLTVRYDASDRCVWVENWDGGLSCVLDLDDASYTGLGYEWAGFSGKFVNVSISLKKLMTSSGSILIYSLNGNPMAGDTVRDVQAPSMAIDAENYSVLPDAEVGKGYPVFSSIARDAIDGDCTDRVAITLRKPSGESEAVSGASITPTEAGTYTLAYSVSDRAGNTNERRFDFTAYMALDPLAIRVDGEIPASVKVGERVYVPQAEAVGGSLQGLELRVSVYNFATGQTYDFSDGYFVPIAAGHYIIRYEASDYLNEETVAEYKVTAVRGEKPIVYFAEAEDFAKLFIGGKQTMLPEMEAYDYVSFPAAVQKAKMQILYKYNGESAYTPLDGNMFVPDKNKQSVSIKYVAYCGETIAADGSNAEEMVYADIPIIVPEQADAYFAKDNMHVIYNKNYLEFAVTDTGKDAASLEFANVLPANSFQVTFDIAQSKNDEKLEDAGKNNFEEFVVTLTDWEKPSVSLTFAIQKNTADKNKSDVIFNGTRYEMAGSFYFNPSVSANPFMLQFNNNTCQLLDYNYSRILTVKEDDAGKAFNGFPSGAVRMRITLRGISGESSFRLSRIVNQSFYASYKGGELVAFEDRMKPVIELDSVFSMEGSYNKNFVFPSAKAYDVLDPYVDVSLQVEDPSGNILYNGPIDEKVTLKLTQYGTYIANYTATDTSGCKESLRKVIEVSDKEAPQLFVQGEIPKEATVGTEFDLPKVAAFDNRTESENIRIYIFLTDPQQSMRDVSAEKSVKLEERGRYSLIIYALDEVGNMTMRTTDITVS